MDQARSRFSAYLNRRHRHSSTPKHYLSDLDIFTRTVPGKSPEDIGVRDINRFIDSQLAAGLKPATINRRLASLHTFFEFLALEDPEREWPNPVIKRRHHLKTGRQLPRDLPDADVARLFSAITDPRDRAMFGLMLGAGLRVGDVDLMAGRAIVRGSKPGHDRAIYLTPALTDALGRFLAQRPEVPGEDHVFLLHRRLPCAWTLRDRLTRYAEHVDLHVTPHRLRHTLATRLVNRGMPIQSLRKLMGHRSIDTTLLYAQLYDETVHAQFRDAMLQMESIAVEDWPQPRIALPVLAEGGG